VNIRAKANPATTMSPAEWESRVDLAAVYRLVAHYGWDDVTTTTHIVIDCPRMSGHFLAPDMVRTPHHY
jgi:ribulose-5-phosphate 4-epimerase/fuculose-1-phosphate aldolase